MYSQSGDSGFGRPSYDGGGNPSYSGNSSGGNRPNRQRVRALFSFQAENPGDLSFQSGDIIEVISETSSSGPEWWKGEFNGKRGSFPINHVELLANISAPPSASSLSSSLLQPPSYKSTPNATPKGSIAPDPYTQPAKVIPGGPIPLQIYNPPNIQTNSTRYTIAMAASKYKDAIDDLAWKYKLGLMSCFVFFIFSMFALFVPWYYNFIPGQQIKIWQWTGIAAYDFGTVNPWFANLNTGPGFTNYMALGFNNINIVMITSLALLLIAFFLNILLGSLFWMKARGTYDNKRMLLFISLLLVLFELGATMQFLRFGQAYTMEAEIGCTVGPCISFSGAIGGRLWGPGFGWIAGMVCLGPAIVSFGIAVVATREYS